IPNRDCQVADRADPVANSAIKFGVGFSRFGQFVVNDRSTPEARSSPSNKTQRRDKTMDVWFHLWMHLATESAINPPDVLRQNVSRTARSPEELFPLIEFCRAGKLKEVGEWIAAGKPLDPPLTLKKGGRRRQSPLDVAIEKGFFTLAEMLLDAGCNPMAN